MPLVLLAEPDSATSELYQRSLEQHFAVRTVTDEAQLTAALAAAAVAAVVLEPTLFGDDAWPAVARIAGACRQSHIPLIICSTQDERRRAVALGVADYLLKPTLPEVLSQALQRRLEQLLSSSQA